MEDKIKPPIWFWVLAGVLMLRSIVRVAGFHIDLATTAADRARIH